LDNHAEEAIVNQPTGSGELISRYSFNKGIGQPIGVGESTEAGIPTGVVSPGET
jgi:hypothetical protein